MRKPPSSFFDNSSISRHVSDFELRVVGSSPSSASVQQRSDCDSQNDSTSRMNTDSVPVSLTRGGMFMWC